MEVTLRSNRGDDEIVLDLGPAEAYGSEAGAVSSFKIRGQHWDGDHDHELFTSVEGLWLRNEDLTAVRDRVAEWVQQPLDRLATSELVGDFELARLPGQSLRLRFGPPQISSPAAMPYSRSHSQAEPSAASSISLPTHPV